MFTASDSKLHSLYIERIINPERYSSYSKLLRITTYVLQFLRNCRKRDNKESEISEIDQSELLWIQAVQRQFKVEKVNNVEAQLGLFSDQNGIIRCRGRIGKSSLIYQSKYPALLPRDNFITTLIIRHCHERVFHNGVKETLSEIRTRFWICRGRQSVKKELNQCIVCKRIQGKPFSTPPTTDLPSFRVKEDYAFMSVGVDFAGPLFIKRNDENKSNEMSKTYIALFTCATSRAVHLELVENLQADTFIRCLRRFICRRGMPRLIVSDNAKTFKSTSVYLKSLFKRNQEIERFLMERRITWRFNLTEAPWWGGFFERMVKCVKLCLKKVLANARLTFDELNTTLVEIEAVLNCRPLTYLYSDSTEEALTPSHLLLGRRLLTLPAEPYSEDDPDYKDEANLPSRARYLALKLSHFRRRWRKEYLLELREHHRISRANDNGSKGTKSL